MVQIVKEPGFGTLLGQSLGTGLGSGLQELAKQKLQQIQLEKAGLPGVLANLDPQVQAAFLRNFGAEQEKSKKQEAADVVEQTLSGGTPQQTDTQQQIQPDGESVSSPEAAQPLITKEDRLSQEIKRLRDRESDTSLSPAARIKIRETVEKKEDKLAKQLEEKTERGQKVFELNKEQIKEIRDKSRGAKEQTRDLERLVELDKTGKLDSATYDAFLKNSGFDIAALRSPESQEFNKVVNNFVRDIKSIFGARISNQEMEQFMKTLPSLSQSPEGRKRVTANLLRISRLNEDRGKLLNNMIKKHKGALPDDFLAQIDDRMEKKLEKASKVFKKDLSRKVPEAESAIKVAAGAAAGKSVPILGGAATGALIGSVVPGLGTGVGALAGGAAGLAGPSVADFFRKLGG